MRRISAKRRLSLLAVAAEGYGGDTFQGTIDQDGVIAIDYDHCQDGRTDIQLVFAR